MNTRFIVPELAVSHFHLRAGDVVADIGAGSGFFEKVLSKAVGPDGTVYACEIQKTLADTLEILVRKEHLGNVKTLWCDLESAGSCTIRDNSLDAIVLANTLFQIGDKDTAFREIVRMLRPAGGKLLVLDWSDSFAGLGPQPSDVFTEEALKTLATSHGLVYERSFPAGEHHYGAAFRKQ